MVSHRTPRRGLTLVELMVAAAASLLIMTILASAFQTGMDTLSQLKSVGDLQERLRVAGEKLKEDLKAPHFNDASLPGGKLSYIRYDQGAVDPSTGMFRIVQAGASYQEVGATTDPRTYSTVASPAGKVGYSTAGINLPNRPAAAGGNAHAMQFAVKLDGKTRQKVFTAPRPAAAPGKALDNKMDNLIQNPAATYATRWAIVTYFLADSGQKTGNGTALFNLHRRVQLVAEEPGAVIMTPDSNYSIRPLGTNGAGPYAVNTVADLTAIANRPGTAPYPALLTTPAFNAFLPVGDGSDIILSNTVSFEIKANWDSNTYRKLTPTAPPSPPPPAPGIGDVPNPDYPFDDLPYVFPNGSATPVNQSSSVENLPRIFDAAGAKSSEPNVGIGTVTTHGKVRINGLQIKLRVWDPNHRMTRQVTIVQDM